MELTNRSTSPKEHDASVAKKLGKGATTPMGAPKDRGVTDAEAIRVDPDVVSSNAFINVIPCQMGPDIANWAVLFR